jgi:hypothetical protein
MQIRVDGHDIPVLTLDDLDEEDKAAYAEPVKATISVPGGLEGAILPYSPDKAVMYDVASEIPNGPVLDFTLVRPPGDDPTMALPSLRPLRAVGRENPVADIRHQVSLFHAVGAVTVAGGHVEMAMRRVYVSLTGGKNEDLDSAPTLWADLDKKLAKLCQQEPEAGIRPKLRELLAAAEAEKLRDKRNTIIHGYWWLIPMDAEHVWSARYHTGSEPPANGYAKPGDLLRLAERLFELAASFEALVTLDWPLAIVPALGQVHASESIELHERADNETAISPAAQDDSAKQRAKPPPKQKPRDKRRKRRRR